MMVFISDLHLQEDHPETVEIFLKLLNKCQTNSAKLYILGDFFEVWIGDDDPNPFHQKIIAELKKATQAGLAIYFMHGNRDFLVGKKFFQATGCTQLADRVIVDIFGEKTLLMHGDTLCTDDVAYQRFRKKARNPILQKLFLWRSLSSRQAIATNYRAQSKQHVSLLPENIMDVVQAEVEREMKSSNVKYLIHGHTHRPAIHEFMIGSDNFKRTVLGAWHTEGSALICEENRGQRLITF
jgi:UDP-2,3-diacylglucosamine hydrolase